MKKVYLEDLALIVESKRGFPIVATDIGIRVDTIKKSDDIAIMRLINSIIIKRVSEKIYKIGGDINSITSPDASFFAITSTARYYQNMIELIGPTLTNLAFDSKEIEEVKMEILPSSGKKHPIVDVYNSFLSIFYELFLHGDSPIQELNREIICGIGEDELVYFYNKYYNISNMVMAVVGDVSPESVKDIIKEKFIQSKRGTKLRINQNYPEIKFIKPKEIIKHVKSGMSWVIVGYPVPSRTSKDAHISELITLILDETLGREIRSKGRGYVADVMKFDYFGNANIACIASVSKKEWIEETRQTILHAFEKLKHEYLSDDELNYYKKVRINIQGINMDTLTTRARMTVMEYLYGLKNTDFLDAFMNIESVDISRVSKKYFNGNFISLVIEND
jgi:predicted Zn-dependent peptidase